MKTCYAYPFLDFSQLNEEMKSHNMKSYEKLPFMYEKMQGSFYDQDKDLIKEAALGVVAIGGFPTSLSVQGKLMLLDKETTLEEIKSHLYKTIGMSSFMSYLNPNNKNLLEITEKVMELKHYSSLHTINLSIMICGITSGVEHELSSQRDIVHLSRLTVAKTIAQKSPCLVLRNEKYYSVYKQMIKNTNEILSQTPLDDLETRNLLYPTAKASAVIITGSLKNLLKLVDLKNSGGKEDELVDILNKLENIILELFPELISVYPYEIE